MLAKTVLDEMGPPPSAGPFTDYLTEALHRASDHALNAEGAVLDALTVLREAKAATAEIGAVEKRARALITEIMGETGQSVWDTEIGSAYMTSPSERTGYDTKALDALAASDATLARVLGPHRKVTQVAASLAVKLK